VISLPPLKYTELLSTGFSNGRFSKSTERGVNNTCPNTDGISEPEPYDALAGGEIRSVIAKVKEELTESLSLIAEFKPSR